MNDQPKGFRPFVIIWLARSLAVLGNALAYFTVTVWLTQDLYPRPEQSALLAGAISAMGLAAILPEMLTSPAAGTLADKFSKRTVMLTADIVLALASGVLAWTFFAGQAALVPAIVLMALISAAMTVHGVAFETALVVTVPSQHLPRANAMMQTSSAISEVLSPMMAAALLSLPAIARRGELPSLFRGIFAHVQSAAGLVMTFQACIFLVSAVVLMSQHIPSREVSHGEAEQSKTVLSDVMLGARFIWARKPLVWMVITIAMMNVVAGSVNVFEPLIVKGQLGDDWASRGFVFETAFAFYISCTAASGVIGGVIMSVWGGLKRHRVYGMLIPLSLAMLGFILFASSKSLYMATGFMCFVEILKPAISAHGQTIWQSQVPAEIQGRVFAVRRIVSIWTVPISIALAGAVSARFGSGASMIAVSAFGAAVCFSQLFNRPLLEIDEAPASIPTISAARDVAASSSQEK